MVRQSGPLPNYQRIVLRSADRDAGSSRVDARFTGVAVQAPLDIPAVLFVESFCMDDKDTGALVGTVLEARLRGVHHPASWASRTKGASDLLAAWLGYEAPLGPGTGDCVGILVTDPSAFNNRTLNVYFTGAGSAPLADFQGDWVLVLGVASRT